MNQKLTVPVHIAVIMDGNRRWAKAKKLPCIAGHQRVAEKILEPLVEHASRKNIRYLTFWAFSTENWQRNKTEVEGIIKIFRHIVRRGWQKLHKKGVRIKIIGDISKFPQDLQKSLSDIVEQTKNNETITSVFALNYGGRDEIIRAINKLHDNSKSKKENVKIIEEKFKDLLDTADIPDPDMIVRTGGEQRLSGFLLWQCQYSELYFAEWLMPEFTPEKLDKVIKEYRKRQRRFGC